MCGIFVFCTQPSTPSAADADLTNWQVVLDSVLGKRGPDEQDLTQVFYMGLFPEPTQKNQKQYD